MAYFSHLQLSSSSAFLIFRLSLSGLSVLRRYCHWLWVTVTVTVRARAKVGIGSVVSLYLVVFYASHHCLVRILSCLCFSFVFVFRFSFIGCFLFVVRTSLVSDATALFCLCPLCFCLSHCLSSLSLSISISTHTPLSPELSHTSFLVFDILA